MPSLIRILLFAPVFLFSPDLAVGQAPLDNNTRPLSGFDEGHVTMTSGMAGDFWDNVALIVLNAPDLESAEAMVQADPSVQAYIFKTQVRPFTIHSIAK
ncbi:MAG: hypothetical protein HKN04_10735 [Rhodothermaceae bacterium]|nr:hypothetical protein [Rhodothermaceae bacterium]